MTVFVTGATGFIGSHFLRLAGTRGIRVRAQRRPGSDARVPVGNSVDWVEKPLDEITTADLQDCDGVLHLAAHSFYLPDEPLSAYLYWNTFAPTQLLERAAEAGAARIVATGSCFEYGAAANRYDFIPPDAPLEPGDFYSISKAAATPAFIALARERGLRLTILRLFNVYGDGQLPGQFWPDLKRAALAGEDFEMTPGDQVRDFTPVETVVEALMDELSRSVPEGDADVRNFGSGNPQTLADFARHWWRKLAAKGELKVGAKPHREAEILRYVPKI